MTNQSVLQEPTRSTDARQISELLDGVLQTQGITAKVAILDSCCYILLIAHQLPTPGVIVNRVQNQLQESSFAAIDRFKIYGRQIGRKLPLWQQEFAI